MARCARKGATHSLVPHRAPLAPRRSTPRDESRRAKASCAPCAQFFRKVFPKWLPYTVGLLIIGIVLGILAQYLATRQDCPMYALKYDGARPAVELGS